MSTDQSIFTFFSNITVVPCDENHRITRHVKIQAVGVTLKRRRSNSLKVGTLDQLIHVRKNEKNIHE
jgi:hypothetical protein